MAAVLACLGARMLTGPARTPGKPEQLPACFVSERRLAPARPYFVSTKHGTGY